MASKAQSSIFEKLYKIDVKDRTQKKGKFDYLPWQTAIHLLMEQYPLATWRVVEHYREIKTEQGLVRMGYPYFYDPIVKGMAVETEVEIDGMVKSEILPVIDFRMKIIEQPDWFQINTSIKRCLVKNLAMFGLGLNVYEGGENWQQDTEQDETGTKEATAPTKKAGIKVPETPKEIFVEHFSMSEKEVEGYNRAILKMEEGDKLIKDAEEIFNGHEVKNSEIKPGQKTLLKRRYEKIKAVNPDFEKDFKEKHKSLENFEDYKTASKALGEYEKTDS